MIKRASTTLGEVIEIIAQTLGIEDRAHSLNADTPLFGSMPELDSLAVVKLAAALETRFGFEIDDSEFTMEIFATVGTLAEFVDQKRK
jgi:acyl carrier protein